MIGSFLVGISLAGAYFYSMRRTSLNPARGALASGFLGSLGGFFVRASLLMVILVALARTTAFHVTGVVIAFMTAFLVLLFAAAGRIFLSDLKARPR